ncbi:hypothetical protein HDU79_000086 [Rhizoclosmatium sp. JEL0117]|nr:hypothetical protein HDU79_000086 [Rhizoclosmatium sp. JEL0117]
MIIPPQTQKPRRRRSQQSAQIQTAAAAFKPLLFLAFAVAAVGAQSTDGPNNTAEPSMTLACVAEDMPSYNLPFHIGGIFILLAVSSVGIFGTLALGSRASSPAFATTLQIFKMFGIGVICATAWIHLLPDAFSQFNNPCLPSAWQKYGSNFVGVFGMTAAFAIQLIELSAVEFKKKKEKRSSQFSAFSSQQDCTVSGHDQTGVQDLVVREETPFLISDSTEQVSIKMSEDIKTNEFTIQDAIPSAHSGTSAPPSECTQGIIERDSELGILLLETGIIFHSMVIGITLGVTADDSFSSLLAAVAFHQMFEGMALGCLITSLRTTTFKKLLMCLAYPLTTPVGIAIGIGLREVYNTNDGGLILTRGIFNSLSAGILFYNTYTELMSAEVSHSAQFGAFSGGFKAVCFGAMYLGAAAMAVVANWA